MSDIRANGSGTKFYYTENLANPRDGKAYVEVEDHWNEVTNALDTAYPSEFTIFTGYKDDDVNKTTLSYTIPSSTLVLADSLANDYDRSYITYQAAGGRLKRVLANSSLEDISAIDLLRDYDGNIYRTLQIGAQEWTIDNLRTTHYADGTAIPRVEDDALWLADTDGAYCYYQHNDGFKDIYGCLYNWHATQNAHGLAYFTDDGVLQLGWRVPLRADYDTLITAMGGGATGGGSAKERGYAHWDNPNYGAIDLYGLRERSSVNRFYDSEDLDVHGFINMGIFEDWWTSEQYDADQGYAQYLDMYSTEFHDYHEMKYGGAMIRCVRDV